MGIAAGCVLAGRYRVIRPVGAGGMGEVYEADHETLGRRVAVKVLLDEDKKALARFEQEARALGRLAHPHVVKILDFHRDEEGRPLLVMEILEGEPLSSVMRREKTLTPERAMRIARETLDALAAAHDAGIIHRDIKPSNIFLARLRGGDGEVVKLIDFGVAKVFGGGGPKTTEGAVVGTASYLAPEQLMGLDLDARVDVRALGLVLFEMLAGRKPWRSTKGGLELAAEIIREEPLTFAEIGLEVERHLERVVAQAIARDPDVRYLHARAMYNALRPVSKSPRVTLPMRTLRVHGAEPAPIGALADDRATVDRRLVIASVALAFLSVGCLVALLSRGAAPTAQDGPSPRPPSSTSSSRPPVRPLAEEWTNPAPDPVVEPLASETASTPIAATAPPPLGPLTSVCACRAGSTVLRCAGCEEAPARPNMPCRGADPNGRMRDGRRSCMMMVVRAPLPVERPPELGRSNRF